jgi:hypothetical protein
MVYCSVADGPNGVKFGGLQSTCVSQQSHSCSIMARPTLARRVCTVEKCRCGRRFTENEGPVKLLLDRDKVNADLKDRDERTLPWWEKSFRPSLATWYIPMNITYCGVIRNGNDQLPCIRATCVRLNYKEWLKLVSCVLSKRSVRYQLLLVIMMSVLYALCKPSRVSYIMQNPNHSLTRKECGRHHK